MYLLILIQIFSKNIFAEQDFKISKLVLKTSDKIEVQKSQIEYNLKSNIYLNSGLIDSWLTSNEKNSLKFIHLNYLSNISIMNFEFGLKFENQKYSDSIIQSQIENRFLFHIASEYLYNSSDYLQLFKINYDEKSLLFKTNLTNIDTNFTYEKDLNLKLNSAIINFYQIKLDYHHLNYSDDNLSNIYDFSIMRQLNPLDQWIWTGIGYQKQNFVK